MMLKKLSATTQSKFSKNIPLRGKNSPKESDRLFHLPKTFRRNTCVLREEPGKISGIFKIKPISNFRNTVFGMLQIFFGLKKQKFVDNLQCRFSNGRLTNPVQVNRGDI